MFDIQRQVMASFTLRFHMESSIIAAVATSLFFCATGMVGQVPSSGEIENTLR